ncbi:MAG: hypothetical protein AMXMBFR47_02380 [Planctomycetota bacterium]
MRAELSGLLPVLSNFDPLFVWGNRAEGVLWTSMGLGILLWSRRRDARQRRLSAQAMIVLILFGVSDFVEATTGAWWRPWWLFAWKAACVLLLIWVFARLLRGGARSG